MLSIPSRAPKINNCLHSTLCSVPAKLVPSAAIVSWQAVSLRMQAAAQALLSSVETGQGAIQSYSKNCLNVRQSEVLRSPLTRGINMIGICDLPDLLQQVTTELQTIKNSANQNSYVATIMEELSPFTMTTATAALFLTSITDSMVDFCAHKKSCEKVWVHLAVTELAKWGSAALVFSVSGIALQPALLAYGASRTISSIGKWIFSGREISTVRETTYPKSIIV